MTYNVRNIALAVVLAAIAGFLVIAYVGKVQKQAVSGRETVQVLVAAHAVPAGTSVAAAVAGHDFVVRQVVRADAVPGAFTAPSELNQELVLGQPLAANQQLTGSMLRASQNVRITRQVSGTYRAEQLSVNKDAVLVGTLRAGDHVDVVGTFPIDNDLFSRIIVRDVQVLSTSDSGVSSGSLNAGTDTPSVILAIPDTAVPKVNIALSDPNKLWLVVRPENGARDGTDGAYDTWRALTDGLPASEVAKLGAKLGAGQ
jgi:Flp pilus assembly protein CpaB